MKLLSFPSLVESPFIIVKIGDYTFGSYTKTGNNLSSSVTYPNFMQSIDIVKVNGAVNTYILNIVYVIKQEDETIEKGHIRIYITIDEETGEAIYDYKIYS